VYCLPAQVEEGEPVVLHLWTRPLLHLLVSAQVLERRRLAFQALPSRSPREVKAGEGGHPSPVASMATTRIGLLDLPVAAGGSAFGCTGDLVSTFFVETLGEEPMIEVVANGG
jgi:hypothetical protein